MRSRLLGIVALAAVGAACGSTPAVTIDLDSLRSPPKSCAYQCPNSACSEATTPYACDAMLPWAQIPHDDPCPAWDAKYPAVTPGQCTVTDPSGDAAAYAGTDAAGHVVLADGHWLKPAGADWVFADLTGGLTSGLLMVPGTTLALTVDTGEGDHVVRLVDVSLVGSGDPTLARVQFAAPRTLNSGIAYVAPDLVYVATDDGMVQALKLDVANKTLVQDDSRNLALPMIVDGTGAT
ncbi:MAG TPA: hypothetical protein VLM85_14850, partial [Polyangiaceae bacterium]|nr:hypothetical protein [Polyangiaceae bacterium]